MVRSQGWIFQNMPPLQESAIVAGIAFASCLILTALAKPLAIACNFVDSPDGRRKAHGRSVPLGGGLCVGAAILAALAIHASLAPDSASVYSDNARFFTGCFLASLVLCIVGVLDDRIGLRGRQKLLGQCLAIAILISITEMWTTKLGLFGRDYDLGVAAIPFTVLWLLGAVNALNLMDGIDGLAATIGAAGAFALAGMCLLNDRAADALLALALGGALLGFLCHNMPPASIFLGDTGSMLIGLLLGTLALHSSLKGPATVALTAPFAVLAVPFVDVTAAILRRRLTGRSIYAADRGHMHHVIMGKGFSGSATVGIIGFATLVTCGAALASVYWKNELYAGISVLLVIVVFVALRIFGYSEYLLIRNRMLQFGRSLFDPNRTHGEHRESAVHIQGSRDWASLWSHLRSQVPNDVVRIGLDIDLPRLHEGFHARWERAGVHDEVLAYQQVFPIVAESQVIGRFEVTGIVETLETQDGARSAWMLHALVQQKAQSLLAAEADSTDARAEPMLWRGSRQRPSRSAKAAGGVA